MLGANIGLDSIRVFCIYEDIGSFGPFIKEYATLLPNFFCLNSSVYCLILPSFFFRLSSFCAFIPSIMLFISFYELRLLLPLNCYWEPLILLLRFLEHYFLSNYSGHTFEDFNKFFDGYDLSIPNEHIYYTASLVPKYLSKYHPEVKTVYYFGYKQLRESF